MNHNRIALFAIPVIICLACSVDPSSEPSQSPTYEKSPREITIASTLEDRAVEDETKTTLSPTNTVLWSAADKIAVVSNGKDLVPMSLSDLEKVAKGKSVQVMLVNPQTSGGLVLGHTTGSSTETMSSESFSSYDQMKSFARNLMEDETYLLTLTKTSESVCRIQGSDGLYLYRTSSSGSSSGHVWNTSTGYVDFTLSSASVSSGIASDCDAAHCIQFSMSNSSNTNTYYINASSDGITLTTTNGAAASVWYVFRPVTGDTDEFQMDPSGAGKTVARFTGTLSDANVDHYCVYPTTSDPTFDGSSLSFKTTKTQTYAPGTFADGANPFVGHLEETDGIYTVDFKNVCGALKLSFTGTCTVYKIDVTDNNTSASLWGDATISTDEIGTGGAVFSGGDNTLKLECGEVTLSDETPTDFYLVAPVGAFSQGFTITVSTSSGNYVMSTTRDNSIVRSSIREMPARALSGFAVPEVNTANSVAAYYVENSSSSFSSSQSFFNDSRMTDFMSASDLSRYDQPESYTIRYDLGGSQTGTLTVSEDEAFNSPVLVSEVSGTSCEITNFVPGKQYYYKVETSNGAVVAGSVKAVGQLRMIRIDSGWNIRDLGGWTGLGGKRTLYGLVYRGGSLNTITEAEGLELGRIGLKSELDLRGALNEGKWANNTTIHSRYIGSTNITLPSGSSADITQVMVDYGEEYPLYYSSVVRAVAAVIRDLRDDKPVYFHCKSGADRTGDVALAIEGILGFSDNDLAKEFELTRLSNEPSDNMNSRIVSSDNYTKRFYTAVMSTMAGTSKGVATTTLTSVFDRCYYYLNRYFYDHFVEAKESWSEKESGATGDGFVGINADDLDYLICRMLGMTAEEYAAGGYRPSWAVNYSSSNTLDNVIAGTQSAR